MQNLAKFWPTDSLGCPTPTTPSLQFSILDGVGRNAWSSLAGPGRSGRAGTRWKREFAIEPPANARRGKNTSFKETPHSDLHVYVCIYVYVYISLSLSLSLSTRTTCRGRGVEKHASEFCTVVCLCFWTLVHLLKFCEFLELCNFVFCVEQECVLILLCELWYCLHSLAFLFCC